MKAVEMKVSVVSFYVFFAVVHSNENDETEKDGKIISLLESHAVPLIEKEFKYLQSHSEQRYNFSRRLIPFFENYSTTQTPSLFTTTMIQILGGSSQVTAETSHPFQNILNEVWSLTFDSSKPRIGEFVECTKNEMSELRIGKILKWAKDLIDRDEPQIELALKIIRRAITSTEADMMMINAVNAECVARVLLTLPQRYSEKDACYQRSTLKNCSQQCHYVDETHYCLRSWVPRQSSSTNEIKNIMEEVANAGKVEHFDLDEGKILSYVTEENFNTNLEQLEIVAPVYFTMRNNITEVWEALENQKRVISFIRDGLPVEDTIQNEFDFDSLPDVSKKDLYLADLFLKCTLNRRRPNYQEYFYDRLHCKDGEYVSGMLLVANLVDEYNMARVGLECYADIEETLSDQYTETLSDEFLPLSIRD